MKFTGKITDYEEKTGTSKKGDAYTVRSYRLEEVEGRYPNSLMVESFNKEFDGKKGDIVEVDCNTKCEIYNGRMYNKISAWKMDVLEKGSDFAPIPAPEPHYAPPTDDATGTNEDIPTPF